MRADTIVLLSRCSRPGASSYVVRRMCLRVSYEPEQPLTLDRPTSLRFPRARHQYAGQYLEYVRDNSHVDRHEE